MKKYTALFIAIAAVAPVQAMAAADWTLWTSAGASTASGTIGSITVTYTGSLEGVDYSSYIYDVPASFTSGVIDNTPGSNGTIRMTGGTTGVNNFHFSAPVVNPVMDLFSVGQNGVPVTFNFLNGATFTILSQGAGHWGGGSLIQSFNTVTGLEGNGLIQFSGTYTDISFTTPNYENYYGATVGTVPVPEPETYAMLLAGLGLLGFVGRRRKQQAV